MDNIYIKLIPNEERAAANHPSWVAPINPKSPEGKKWKLGVKIGDTWYDPAGFDTTDENDQPTGGLTVRLVHLIVQNNHKEEAEEHQTLHIKRILQSLVLMLVINHEGINNL